MKLIEQLPSEIQTLLNENRRKESSEFDWLIGENRYIPPEMELMIDAVVALSLGKNVLLKGPTGSGKTVFAETLSYLFHQPMFSINCSVDLDAEALLGFKTISYDGDKQLIDFVSGPVIHSMNGGNFLYIDELNMANPDTLPLLYGVLDYRRRVTNPFTGEIVTAKKGFNAIASINEGYIGTTPLNPALKNRFTVIEVPYLEGEQLKMCIHLFSKLQDEKMVDRFVKLSSDLVEAVKKGKVDEEAASTRSLLDAADLSSIISPKRAVLRSIIDKLSEENDRVIVKDLVEMVF